MSNITQGVMALKQWMFPPLLGYRIVVGVGAVISLSFTSFAGLAAKQQSGYRRDFSKRGWCVKFHMGETMVFFFKKIRLKGKHSTDGSE